MDYYRKQKRCKNCETIISDRATFCLRHRPSSMKGKKQSIEHIKKRSAANLGQKRSKETIEKLRISHLGKKQSEEIKIKRGIYKIGKENHRFGKKHTKESRQKISLAGLNRPVSNETKQKMREARLGKKFGLMSKKGKNNLSKAHKGKHHSLNTEFKKGCISLNKGKKASEKTLIKMRLAAIKKPKKFKETSIEIKIKQELLKRNIKFKQNEPILGIANVDFIIPELQIIIECDGCFWHGCPEHNPTWNKRKEKDAFKTKKLTEAGFKVFRFWEHEINRSPEECLSRIFQ